VQDASIPVVKGYAPGVVEIRSLLKICAFPPIFAEILLLSTIIHRKTAS
jgi:hypothetical protein